MIMQINSTIIIYASISKNFEGFAVKASSMSSLTYFG